MTRLHDEVYARLRHGRLVLIGAPGAGKTGAMLLLLVEALKHRNVEQAVDRAAIPVPVWLTLGSWNPATRSVREWVIATMARDYPYLRASDFGPDAIGRMFDAGRIALFLDGLDEMPDAHRDRAVERLTAETPGLRVTLSSRPDQYRATLGAGRQLPYTAVIELHPVAPQAATRYLLDGQIGSARDSWRQVTNRLQDDPDGVLARTLNTPLTLSLARSAYLGADPTALLTPELNSPMALRRHLLDRIMLTAYPEPQRRARADYWLGWIATKMNAHPAGATRDLRWWDIPMWTASRSRQLLGALIGGLVLVGLALGLQGLLQLSIGRLSIDYQIGPLSYLSASVSLTCALLGGLVIAVAIGHTDGVSSHSAQPQAARPPLIVALLFGLPVGLSAGILISTGGDPLDLVTIAFLLVYTLSFGAAAALAYGLAIEPSGGSPRALVLRRPTRQDLLGGRRGILAGGIPIGIVVAVLLGFVVAVAFADYYDNFYTDYVFDDQGNALPRARSPLPPEPPWILTGVGLGFGVLVVGYGVAVLAGLFIWLVGRVWKLPIATAANVTPRSVYRKDVQTQLISALLFAVAAGLVAGLTTTLVLTGANLVQGSETAFSDGIQTGLAAGVIFGSVFAVIGGFRDSATPYLFCTELAFLLRGRRVRFLRVLETARERQILRQAGAVYQFRHADLQDRLADQHRRKHGKQNKYTPLAENT